MVQNVLLTKKLQKEEKCLKCCALEHMNSTFAERANMILGKNILQSTI
jgi:hypothetical protein